MHACLRGEKSQTTNQKTIATMKRTTVVAPVSPDELAVWLNHSTCTVEYTNQGADHIIDYLETHEEGEGDSKLYLADREVLRERFTEHTLDDYVRHMKEADLTLLLDSDAIDYPEDADKDELVRLVEKNIDLEEALPLNVSEVVVVFDAMVDDGVNPSKKERHVLTCDY